MPCGEKDEFSDFELNTSLKLGAKIGEGSFAQVRLATEADSGKQGAAKIMELISRNDKAISQEADIWALVGPNPHCVQLYKVIFHGRLCIMFMEQCLCSLLDRLETISGAKQTDVKDIFRQMLLGIQHCHGKQVVHRDIKPDNFLYGGDDGKTIKLCDFGLAAVLPKGKKLRGIFGTAPYMSPEMLGNKGHNAATDVWSFGATTYVLMYAEFPYMPARRSVRCMKEAILADDPTPKFVPSEKALRAPPKIVTDLIRSCLNRHPKERISVDSLLQHPFFTEAANKGPKRVSTEDDAQFELPAVIRKARKNTVDFKKKVDPTVQKRLDELLAALRRRGSTSFDYFSESDEYPSSKCIREEQQREETEGRIVKRTSKRNSTHSGVVICLSIEDTQSAQDKHAGTDEI